LLRKFLKYLLILVLACGIVFVLFSCGARKSATTGTAPPERKKGADSPQDRTMFAQMYVDGCAERMKGNLQEALKLFEKCREIDPVNAAVRYELATIHKLLGNIQVALEHSQFSAVKESQNEWYQLLYIDCLIAAKQYQQAIRVRETLVKNFPGKHEYREDLAIDYAISGQYEKSFRIYEELERTYGVNEQITLNKVKLLKSQKKYREIEEEFLRLCDSNKNEPRYYAFLAEHYLEQNEQEKAKSMYDKILEIDPSNPTVHLALHDYYGSRGEDIKAFDHLRKAFINPELDINTKAGIVGSFYTRAEQNAENAFEQGVELAGLLLKVHPGAPEANALFADFLMLEKKTAEAAKYYYAAAINERKDYRVWENLLFVDNDTGKFDSLEKHSVMAIELFPNQPRNYLYNGLANTHLRNYAKAAESLKNGLEYVVENKSLTLDFLRLLGDAYHYNKEFEKSDRTFDEALKLEADNAYVLNNYAYYLSLRAEQLEKAEKLSRRANELQPNNRNYMDTFGWILYKQKKFPQAAEWLQKASTLGPPNPTILEHYGDALYMINKPDDALRSWNAAKNAGGASEELIKKIKEKRLND
jgi:tetratricopeptide (TPR) repeat protein